MRPCAQKLIRLLAIGFGMLELQKAGRSVSLVTIPFSRNADWRWKLLCISDVHFDSTKCNRELLKTHLDRALDENAGIVIVGDLYDAMQGKYDPRNAKYELRPEYKTERYLDDIVTDCASFLRPYRNNILMLADGNHETAIKNRYETDLIQRTIALLTVDSDTSINYGGYAGWVRLLFVQESNKRKTSMVTINYHHGSGLKSKAAQDRRACTHPDADIFLYGHWHEHWSRYISRQRLGMSRAKLYKDLQLHLGIPGYKDDYADGDRGWCIERGHIPKPHGGWWISFRWQHDYGRVTFQPTATS